MMLDTNALSALALGDRALTDLLRRHPRVSLPFVALAEYQFGLSRSRRKQELLRWLTALEVQHGVLYPDRNTLTRYAEIRGELCDQGTPIPTHDLWIAALGRQHGLAVISRDKHFDLVRGLLRIDW